MRNTVHLGDCLEIMQQIPSGTVDMILCDLPYGTTACKWDTVIPFAPLWEQYERVIKDNGAIVLTASQPFTSALVMSNQPLFKYEIIWQKPNPSNFMLAKKQTLKQHENIVVFYRKQSVFNPQKSKRNEWDKRPAATNNNIVEVTGQRRVIPSTISHDLKLPNSIIKFNRETGFHPTQKPVPLFEYLIKTYTNEGDVVLDNCAGSGTTGIACINTGRDYILIEKEPDYYNIIQERIAKVEQKQASQLFAL